MVSPSPAAPGHVWVLPKEPVTILENLPDYVVAELFAVAIRISLALFEGLGSQGTNLVLQNGTGAGQILPHVILHIVPRVEGDGMPLEWEHKQLSEEEMSTIEMKLKAETKSVGHLFFEKEKPKPIEAPKAQEIKPDEENYQLRHLKRIP